MEHATHRRGSVCTSVLHTRDPHQAATFYTALFGWTAGDASPSAGEHLLLQSDGRTVASVQRSERLAEWVPHVSVDDLDDAIARVIAAGGTMVDRVNVPGVARLAVLRDLEGARCGLWQPASCEGAQVTETIGSLWWVEVLSDDPPRARQFYSSVFGWGTRETAFAPFTAYTVFERDGQQEGGVLPIGRDWGVTPHWNSIWAVDDCDATLQRACELGGSAGFVHTVPQHGRVGNLVDPRGTPAWIRGPVPAGTRRPASDTD